MRLSALHQKRLTVLMASLTLVVQLLFASHLATHVQDTDSTQCSICVAVDGNDAIPEHVHNTCGLEASFQQAANYKSPVNLRFRSLYPVRGPPAAS